MKSISFLLLGALCAQGSQSIAQSKDYGESMQNFTPSKVLENADGSHNHWRSIGQLNINNSCTATLLDTQAPTVTGPTPAYVLTAGHCIEKSNGNIVTDRAVSGTMQFDYFTDTVPFKSYPLKKVAWRSIQGVDLALVELDVSLQKLINDGIQPLKLARTKPADGIDVLIVGAPKGFDKETLRMAACTLQPAQELVEGSWVWRNTLMTRCQDIAGGSSGSPVLDRHSNEIIGVIGTANLYEGIPCQSTACTPVGDAYKAIQGDVYGNPTTFLHRCFIDGYLANSSTSSCPLYPAFTVSAPPDEPARYKKLKKQADGTIDTPTWNYHFFISTAFYRHKTVRTAKDCESARHYSDPISATDAFINSKIGTVPGFYFLCILGVDSAAQHAEVGLLKNALSLPIEILDDTPIEKPDLSFSVGVHVELASTADAYRTYAFKFGPVDTTDCSKGDQYEHNVYMDFVAGDDQLPGKLCSIAYDKAGQASEPRAYVLNPTKGTLDATPVVP